ncbi:hypothetical protein DFQ27_004118 [Actinomortierella ambigua]|uniref:F-box domain-containing protein n=1 Tax=Actinomortierella ambigua TaxID=1343610 RepID=A0A9P6U4X8_9FUNG|nr:hypothetical protein DFQ27_004118 [Actinomortierella ambigua]
MNCPLPIDCIEVILDHLDATTRTKDLRSLLTVNKAFFAASVRRLYADPIETIKSRHRTRALSYPTGAVRRLLALVLRCSPDNSPQAQSLRHSLHADIHALPGILTTDYLSLIKTIQYEYDSNYLGPTSTLARQYPLSICGESLPSWAGLHDAFAWAVCAHRLSEIHSLEIPLRCLPLYSSRIEDMLSIRSLRILTLDIPREHFYAWTTTAIEEVKLDLKTLSCFVSQWSAAYAKLPQGSRTHIVDMQLSLPPQNEQREWWMYEPFASKLKTIFLQMPVSPMRDLRMFFSGEWARFVLAPESFDLARVRSIIESDLYNHVPRKEPWPDISQGKATILQQCRSLQKLELRGCTAEDDAIFKWAVQERQEAAAIATTSSSNSGAGKLLVQGSGGLVPLSELKLVFSSVMSFWQDAVFAFGTTLQSLTIYDYQQPNDFDLCVFRDMPVLRNLFLCVHLFKAAVAPFSCCPGLTKIYLESRSRMHSGQERFGRWDLAQVHVLSLRGNVCHQFNHATLKEMPLLDTLIMSARLGGAFTWDKLSWGPFPRLKTLNLSDTLARTFCWSMLEQCPAVDTLFLDVSDMRSTKKFRFLHLGQRPDFAHERSTSPLAVYPTLRILGLCGYFISDAVLFSKLPRVAPNLTRLSLHPRNRLSYAQLDKLDEKFKFMRDLDYEEDELDC